MVQTGAGLVQMTPQTRRQAKDSISFFRSDGGTAIGAWLNLARALFDSVGPLSQKHAILLTDGENHNETPQQLDAAIRNCLGQFQADCRGVGVDWKVEEIRKIAPGAARLGGHHPVGHGHAGGLRRAHAQGHGPRRGRRPAQGVGAAGRPGPVRTAGVAEPSKTSPAAGRRSTP